MAYNLVSLASAFDEIGEDFRTMVEAQFAAGGGWAPLSPVTIALRGGGSTPLIRFGSLMNSWTVEGGPGNISRIGAHSATFGSRHVALSNIGRVVPTAAMHQSGTSKMPARPVKLVDGILEEQIVDAIADHIFSGWA
jgi:hypothetical protein